MTIATILLHASAGRGDPGSGPAAWALGCAAALGARLTALAFGNGPGNGGGAEDGGPGARAAERLTAAAAEAGIDLRLVSERSFAFGLPEVVADHARLHDLMVTGSEAAGPLSDRAMAEHLLFEAGRPVVIVPRTYRGPFRCARIVVAWDNTRTAARALGDSLPLLRRAEEVVLLTIDAEKRIDTSLDEAELLHALARRGIQTRVEHRRDAGRAIAEALARGAAELGADLLVMGAFGHSRMHQLVLGGATRGILAAPRLPVLMSH